MLKFATKQYTVGILSHAKFEPSRWRGGVCTGAPKFPLLVRFGVFQSVFTTSQPAKRAEINVTVFAVQVFYIARSIDETLAYNSVGVTTPNFNFLIIIFLRKIWENPWKLALNSKKTNIYSS